MLDSAPEPSPDALPAQGSGAAARRPDTRAPAPIAQQQRISSLDVLRGVAVLGILLLNIIGFGLPYWAYEDPSVVGGASGANLWAWIMTSVFFEGTFRAMFSLLFGAGVVLLTSRLEARAVSAPTLPDEPAPADIYFRRHLWLIAFGLFDAYLLLWVGDILYTYGMVGLFLYVFRRLRPRTLILIAIGLWIVIVARTLYERHHDQTLMVTARQAQSDKSAGLELSDEQIAAIDEWKEYEREYKPPQQEIDYEIARVQKDYLALFASRATINLRLQTTTFVKYYVLDAAAIMFLGMALLKLGVLSGQRSPGVYAAMAVAGYATGLTINVWETATIVRSDFALESFMHTLVTYDLGRVATVLGHVALILLVHGSGALGWLMRALAACGQMALTNYLMQSILCGAVFYGCGFKLFGSLERWQLYVVVACIWIVQLMASPLWLAHFRFGPAEWVWRSLTYWRRQPMRRTVLRAPSACPVG